MQMLLEFWHNFSHNLFKPLLLFFYLGFLMPILKVPFEFPPAIYHGLTMYLLLAIGWHGGEELAGISMSSIGGVLGFMVTGFLLNFVIGALAYFILKHTTRMREVDRATVAGYYGSDSAGTFATCVGVLATADIVFDSYMPVMLAIMEIPGCLVALLLVARLRRRGMDSTGLLPGEIGYMGSGASVVRVAQGSSTETVSFVALEDFPEDLEAESGKAAALDAEPSFISGAILREVFLNPGLCLLMGGIAIGFISGLQGQKVTAVDDPVFLTAVQGGPMSVLAGNGDDCVPKAEGSESGGPRLHPVRPARAEPFRNDRHHGGALVFSAHGVPIGDRDLRALRGTLRRRVVYRRSSDPAVGHSRGQSQPAVGRLAGPDLLLQRDDRNTALYRTGAHTGSDVSTSW